MIVQLSAKRRLRIGIQRERRSRQRITETAALRELARSLVAPMRGARRLAEQRRDEDGETATARTRGFDRPSCSEVSLISGCYPNDLRSCCFRWVSSASRLGVGVSRSFVRRVFFSTLVSESSSPLSSRISVITVVVVVVVVVVALSFSSSLLSSLLSLPSLSLSSSSSLSSLSRCRRHRCRCCRRCRRPVVAVTAVVRIPVRPYRR